MKHTAEMLLAADQALCTAYTAKAGITKQEALEMMEHETWLTADQAKERGLVDAIMFEEPEEPETFIDGPLFSLPSMGQMEKVRSMLKQAEPSNGDTAFLMQTKLNFLKMKGEER